MKATKEDIVDAAVALFAEKGYAAVSTSMIAGKLGMTKGALYRHFTNKQEILESIIEKMFALDESRANEDKVPAKTKAEDAAGYEETAVGDFCDFVINQFDFWTGNTFASDFRRMITLEQFTDQRMTKLYQDVIGMGPVTYSVDLLEEMIRTHKLNEAAASFGADNLAIQLFAPLKLMIELADGGADRDRLRNWLISVTHDFETRWKA